MSTNIVQIYIIFFQAYSNEIAEFALANGKFGGPKWNPTRMTWIKPSFAWMLYRSGYGKKLGQGRVLRIKLSHETVSKLLSQCKLSHKTQSDKISNMNGRVQWDPERDIFSSDSKKNEPGVLQRTRAIQIGLKG